jgi:AcrR family transcriptional regulator
VSEIKGRAQRRDATDNLARILDAATMLLGTGADPSMGEIARAAGLSRQTVYAHFPGKAAVYEAVAGHLGSQVADLDLGRDAPDAAAALDRWLRSAWSLLERYPAFLNPALFAQNDQAADHEPVTEALRGLLERAQADGFLRAATTDWLVAAIIALGHAAGAEVAGGRMSVAEAGESFRSAALAVCLR